MEMDHIEQYGHPDVEAWLNADICDQLRLLSSNGLSDDMTSQLYLITNMSQL